MSDNHVTAFSSPVPTAEGTFDLMRQGAHRGAADARAAAERAWAMSSLFVRRFLYTASYTVSYGAVFSAVLMAQAVPKDNAAVRGLIDGARAARKKVDDVLGHPADEPARMPALA
jgi:hypothetical protein